MKMGEELYKQNQAAGGATGQAGTTQTENTKGSSDGVDYEVVNEDK